MPWLARLLRGAALASGLLTLLILGGALVADRLLSSEVQLIVPKPDEVVAVDRALWEAGQPVAGIYGVPVGEPLRVVLPDQRRLLRPREDPRRLLLTVDKQRGENPLQVKTVWFIAVRAASGLSLIALLALAGTLWLRRRGRPGERLAPLPHE